MADESLFNVTFRLLILASIVLLSGCDTDKVNDAADKTEYFPQPRSISTLSSRNIGSIFVDVSINDQAITSNFPVGSDQTRVLLTPDLFTSDQNSLNVEFWLTPMDTNFRDKPRLLATANVVVPLVAAGETILLPPIEYRYTDTDSDGLADILEWQITPIDIDSDLLPNSEDDDSDGDGLNDRIDVTPFGEIYPRQDINSLLRLPVLDIDSSAKRLPLTSSVAGSSELQYIQNEMYVLPVGITHCWPFAPAELPPTDQTYLFPWHAIDIEEHVRAHCSNWRISLDASSIQANKSGIALLYFRRFDSSPTLLPLATGSVDNLSNVSVQTPMAIGNALQTVAIDDALRMLFVAPWSTGWLTIWSDKEFEGNSCSVNLSNILY